MLGMSTILLGLMEELRRGPVPAVELVQLQRDGKFLMSMELFTDSYSIWSYLRSEHLKVPTEKATFHHLAFMKEALRCGLIRRYTWIDTRDMAVDALTKGKCDRTAVQSLMAGVWRLAHPQSSHSDVRMQ